MSIALVINGVTYDYPETDDVDWGPEATDWAAAVTNGMLQKAGGLFQLLAELDFGTAYGIKSLYLKTRTAKPADAGQIRFAKTDVLSWRNNSNNGNLDLGINGSDLLTFNGTTIQNTLSVTDTSTIDLTLAADVLSADIVTGSITNSLISSSAAIAYSKLALTGSIVNADLVNVSQSTFKGRAASAGTGAPQDLTATQATAILNNFVGDSGSGGTKGLVPAPASGDAAANKFLEADGAWTTPPGAGDVNGPASSTDNAVVRFDGTTGKDIQNSGVIVDDSDSVSGINDLAVGGDTTLTGTLEVDSLDASKAVVTDGSKILASLAYTNANTASTLVERDGSGNFSAGTITAALSGNASTATTATNATNTAITDDTTTNATMYPTWVTTTSGNLPQKISSSKLTFNPSTATLTTTTVVAAVTGTASGNTTISGQTNHGVVISGSANAMTSTAAGTSGQPLLSGGASADPAYGTLAIGAGGTGQTTKAAAFDALSPMTTGGDLIYGGSSGTGTRLANGSAGQYLKSSGTTAAPAWTSFTGPTITRLTSGTAQTFTPAASTTWMRVRMVGGGGGGQGTGTGGVTTGATAATDTTFGSLTASHGTNTGAGGGASGGNVLNNSGGAGQLFQSSFGGPGQAGGLSAFGGNGGPGSNAPGTGGSAVANSGSGGGTGGAGASNVGQCSSGGAGGYVEHIYTTIAANYTYTVGAAGTGGTAGTSGAAGGPGGTGLIIVEEYVS